MNKIYQLVLICMFYSFSTTAMSANTAQGKQLYQQHCASFMAQGVLVIWPVHQILNGANPCSSLILHYMSILNRVRMLARLLLVFYNNSSYLTSLPTLGLFINENI